MRKNIKQQVELLEAIKSITPTGSRIMVPTDTLELVIRYYSLRPLVFCYKDGEAFSYSNHADLLIWWQQFQDLNRLQALNKRILYLDGLMDFSKKYMTGYFVLTESIFSTEILPGMISKKFFSNKRLFIISCGLLGSGMPKKRIVC